MFFRCRYLVLVIGLLVLVACGGSATPGGSSQPTQAGESQRVFRIWHFEKSDSAMGIAWADALKDFQALHPDVRIEFEEKSFEQTVETAKMVLNSDSVPDVMEINKGNATAGLYAKEGLLTDLTQVAQERGWDKILSPSIQTTCRYDQRGIMGSGNLYGVTTYGEYVMVYYNKNMFTEHNLKLPTTLEELEVIADSFVAKDIAPFSLGALEKWPTTHNWYELVLYQADRAFVSNYELLQGTVDFRGPALRSGSEKFATYVEKGYFGSNANGTSYDDALAAFVQGKNPMMLTGSWAFGGFTTKIKDFDWGIFLMPGKKLNTGSGGNLWVVPANAKNKDLAYDFINLTLQAKSQTAMANAGGIPINADLSQIKDAKVLELNSYFTEILKNDGLAFYPDWPVPGYMDVLGGGLQDLLGQQKSVDEFLGALEGPYNDYKATVQ